MKNNKFNVVITQRDRKVFEFILKYKVVTFKQIKKRIFSNLSESNLRRRLLKLLKEGYINANWLDVELEAIKVYSLNKNNNWQLILHREHKVTPFYSSSIVHDLTLSDIGQRLEKFVISEELLTENEIKGDSQYNFVDWYTPFKELNTDIAWKVDFQGDTFNIAIEYERTIKNIEHYKKRFQEYYNTAFVNAIFYIVENDHMLKRLSKYESKIKGSNKSKFFFITLKDILKDSREVELHSSEGTIVTLY